MDASFVDLRKKSGEIIRALERNERITIFYRGQVKAVMEPVGDEGDHPIRARSHSAFGMWKDREDLGDVPAHVRTLRKGRFGAL